jgi:adenylate cyclase
VSDTDDGITPGDGPVDAIARALEPYLEFEDHRYDLEEVARLSGIDADRLRDFWRALGFPDPRPGERVFGDADVRMLSQVVEMMGQGLVEPEVARQMTRVIGASLDRIAAAQIDANVRQAEEISAEPAVAAALTREAANLVPGVLELVWRRRLAAEARRRMMRSGTEGGASVCVGFADLVGFTAQTQQLDTTALAEVVGRFETIAYDVVGEQSGRVVKTIGDEVLFVHDDVVAGCRIALELARRYREDEALSDVRVGLAFGPVLERDGDVYGHTVNVASRIVSVAYPGSVIVSAEVHDAVRDHEEFGFNSLRSHYLKDIGRVPLWRMRSAGDPLEGSFRSARRDYGVRQRVLEDRWDAHRTAARQRAEGVVEKLDLDVDDLPGRLPDALRGTATPEDLQALIDSPTEREIDALADAVLAADIDPEVQVDMLTDLGLAKAMAELRLEAERKAAEADEEAEAELRRIEEETAVTIRMIEDEFRERVAEVIERATEASRKVDLEVVERLRRVAEETESKAAQAGRDARAKARRAARKRARRRSR